MTVYPGDYVYIDLNGVQIGPYPIVKLYQWRTFIEVVVSIRGVEGSFDIEQIIGKYNPEKWDGKDGF